LTSENPEATGVETNHYPTVHWSTFHFMPQILLWFNSFFHSLEVDKMIDS